MNKLVKLTIALVLASYAFGQTTPTRIRSVAVLPATCQSGDGVKPSDAVALVSSGFNIPQTCQTGNTWTTPIQFSGANTIPYFPSNGISVKGDSHFTTDGTGNFTAVTGTFVGSGTAGFTGFGQGTVPSLANTHTAYLYGASSIATSFGTALPDSPGTQGQALLIDTVPDGTHITTAWGGVILTDPFGNQTISGGNLTLDSGEFFVSDIGATLYKLDLSTDSDGNSEIDWIDGGSIVRGDLAFRNATGNVRLESHATTAARTVSLVLESDPTQILDGCPLGSNQGCVTIDSSPVAFSFGQGSAALHAGGAQWKGNTSGAIWVGIPDVAGANYITLPAATGTASLAVVEDCTTTTACAGTVLANPIIIRGDVTFPGATTVALSALPFTSSSSYSCTASDLTSAAGMVNFTTYTSGSAATLTETGGTNTDHARYICVGF